MNARNRLLTCSCLLLFLQPAAGQSRAELVTAGDLKAAIHDVLSHNNLFDAGYLSDRLGIGLRTSLYGADGDRTSFEGTATRSPPALYGSISYDASVDVARQVSTVRMTFGSKYCASLSEWGSEWHAKTNSGMSTDGGPSYESLVWPGHDGIALMVTDGRGGGCSFELSQKLGRVVKIPVSPVGPRVPASGLSGQIADLLLSDLRNYTEVARILNTEFLVEPESQRNGLLYEGNAGPSRVMFGFKSSIGYYGNDSGWYAPPSFFARPLHIGDRTVTLNLTADTDVACLSPAQLASDLKHRSRRIRKQRGQSGDELVYSVRGANLTNVSVAFKEGCATHLGFRQVTDVAHSLGGPIVFTLDDSLDRVNGILSNEAQQKINLLAFRVRSESLRGIEIVEMPTDGLKGDLYRLKVLISEALRRKHIVVPRGANSVYDPGFSDEVGVCALRQQAGAPVVCVDVWR